MEEVRSLLTPEARAQYDRYARVSTAGQDVAAQREGLAALGVNPKLVYVGHGLTGRNRDRPGLAQALAAVREGDTLVVTKLDRLARSLPDARDIADELTGKGVALSIGGSVYDPNDPVGRLLFNVLSLARRSGQRVATWWHALSRGTRSTNCSQMSRSHRTESWSSRR